MVLSKKKTWEKAEELGLVDGIDYNDITRAEIQSKIDEFLKDPCDEGEQDDSLELGNDDIGESEIEDEELDVPNEDEVSIPKEVKIPKITIPKQVKKDVPQVPIKDKTVSEIEHNKRKQARLKRYFPKKSRMKKY